MRSWVAPAVLLAALAWPGPAVAQQHRHGRGYADVGMATKAERAKARALMRGTNAAAPQLATVRRARRRGYVRSKPLPRPGLIHLRRNGTQFWGRVLDPQTVQALVFWCPTRGRCRLVAFMYRAPAGGRPPTYGGIVGWHRHRRGATWMTHVFLVDRLPAAFARCVPFNALEAAHGPFFEPYRPGLHVNRPCRDTIHLQ